MKLTDQELKDMHHLDQFGLFCDYDEFKQIARAVIEANNAKVLAELKPVATGEANGIITRHDVIGYAMAPHHLYSADQVSAIIQDRDALAARVKELESSLEDAKLDIAYYANN